MDREMDPFVVECVLAQGFAAVHNTSSPECRDCLQ